MPRGRAAGRLMASDSSSGDAMTGLQADTGSRLPLVAEALGYAGGVLAIAAGIYLARDLWPGLSTGGGLAFAGGACVVLGAGGAAGRPTGRPALQSPRRGVWL